jgi:peptidoglycan/LPS O-acetylase OafA/YrhL
MTHLVLKNFNIDSNLMLLISIATCMIFAVLMHFTIEKPFMKLRERVLVRNNPTV